MRPRCCVLIAVSLNDGDGGDTGTVGACVDGAGSGARSICAQPNNITQAGAAKTYDDGPDRRPHARIADSSTLKTEIVQRRSLSTRSPGTGPDTIATARRKRE